MSLNLAIATTANDTVLFGDFSDHGQPLSLEIHFHDERGFYVVNSFQESLLSDPRVATLLTLIDRGASKETFLEACRAEGIPSVQPRATHAFLVFNNHGCIAAMFVDLPDDPQYTAAELLRHTQSGKRVERVPLQAARDAAPNMCTCNGACPRKVT
jgi:hypothetical protein